MYDVYNHEADTAPREYFIIGSIPFVPMASNGEMPRNGAQSL